jgi:hypothetical protein
MKCTMLGALVLMSAAKVILAQDEVQVETVQLTVRHKPTIDGVKVFGDPGLEMQVAVLLPGKPILAVDPEKSRIVSFVDDVGTDLKAGAPTGFFSWVSMSSAFRDEPVPSALLDIKTKTLPAAKAQRLEIDAVVALITASGTQQKSAKVALKKGTKIDFGPIPMMIGSVEKSSFGGSVINVQISSEQRMDAIKEIVFLDAKGKQIDAKSMGTGSFGMGGKKTYTKRFGLPKRLAVVNLRIVSYAKMATIEVPIKLSMGLGLR